MSKFKAYTSWHSAKTETRKLQFCKNLLIKRCHFQMGLYVLSLMFCPGMAYGFFEYFQYDKEYRDWKLVVKCFVIFPISFLPYQFIKLVQAVIKSEDGRKDVVTKKNLKNRPSHEEDQAKR